MAKKVLGKGLQALITDLSAGDGDLIINIELHELKPNPYQPRLDFDAEKLAELTASIREHGVIQPIIVRKNGEGYEIVAGERRWRAASLAGLDTIPAVLREIDDKKVMEIALVENIQREDLNPIEEASAYGKLLVELELTQEELAQKVGRSRSQVANTLRLLNLPEAVQQKLANRELTMGHARAILGLESPEEQLSLAGQVSAEGLSVRQVEEMVSRSKEKASSVPRETKRPLKTPDYIVELEDSLKRELGTRVKIQVGKSGGRILIDYYGDEDLERLRTLLMKQQEQEKRVLNRSFSV